MFPLETCPWLAHNMVASEQAVLAYRNSQNVFLSVFKELPERGIFRLELFYRAVNQQVDSMT